MADEIRVSVKFSFDKGGTEIVVNLSDLVTVTGNNCLHNRQTVGTTEEALLLGDAGTGGYLVAVNRDATNFVELRSGTGATDVVRLRAGELACFRVSPDATAPFVIADTAAVELEYWLIEA